MKHTKIATKIKNKCDIGLKLFNTVNGSSHCNNNLLKAKMSLIDITFGFKIF